MTRKKTDINGAIIIKKYANRRLYNTESSSYVTLDHLAVLVKENKDFVVIDAKTGDDITRSVLAQIIFDKESKDNADDNMLPLSFLKQLISLYGDGIQQFVPTYLQSSLEAFMANQAKMREQFESQSPMKIFEDMTKQNMAMMQEGMKLFTQNLQKNTYSQSQNHSQSQAKTQPQQDGGKAKPKAQTSQTAAGHSTPDDIQNNSGTTDPQIDALQKQLSALQDQISKLGKST